MRDLGVPMASPAAFDFDTHRRTAVDEYARKRPIYNDFADVVRRTLQESIRHKSLKIHSVDARAKSLEGFGAKVMRPSEADPSRPKYDRPLEQIEDLAGARVITFFPSTVKDVDRCIREEFDVVEYRDIGASLLEAERLGYQSVHYIVKLTQQRAALVEYKRFAGLTAEIQVRTVLQHAWAEIEHDIRYKSPKAIPRDIGRRFMALAGLLEIADREFEAIQDADRLLRESARELVRQGKLGLVEITGDALQAFLDDRLGPDARMSEYSYDWTAAVLTWLGFSNLAEVDECVEGYDDDRLSRILAGWRQGQLARFEYMLMAGMGEAFLEKHPWGKEPFFVDSTKQKIEKLRSQGIKIKDFRPPSWTRGGVPVNSGT
jgi:putative GTP pyrophosphokinase